MLFFSLQTSIPVLLYAPPYLPGLVAAPHCIALDFFFIISQVASQILIFQSSGQVSPSLLLLNAGPPPPPGDHIILKRLSYEIWLSW